MNGVDQTDILSRLDSIEASIRQLMVTFASEVSRGGQRHTEVEVLSDWVDSTTFCRLAGIKNHNSLSYFMSRGIFTKASVRNIGTVRRPRYRFHRRSAVDEFLNRSQLQLP